MSKYVELASDCWEVERHSCGQVLRPYCVIILRNKKGRKAVVQASSSDFDSMKRYAEQLSDDLQALTNDQFVDKYKLEAA